jgi:hypothetical protein
VAPPLRQDLARQRLRVALGDDVNVVAEERVELESARVVRGDDGRARGERLERDRGRRLEHRGQHEEIGAVLQVRDLFVGDEAEEANVAGQAEPLGLRLDAASPPGDHGRASSALARTQAIIEQRRVVGQRMEPLR